METNSPLPRRGGLRTRDYMEKMSHSIERLEVCLGGDKVLGSAGLMQQVKSHEELFEKVSTVLDSATKTLASLENHRIEQEKFNETLKPVVEHVQTIRSAFKVAVFASPILIAIVGWGIKSGFFQAFFQK